MLFPSIVCLTVALIFCLTVAIAIRIKVPRPVAGFEVPNLGKVFVEFKTTEESAKAAESLSGRKFDGRTVVTSYYDPEEFHAEPKLRELAEGAKEIVNVIAERLFGSDGANAASKKDWTVNQHLDAWKRSKMPGGCRDQGDAELIVITGLSRGHDDTPFGRI
jgi:RNA recognition motif-containing protein